MKQYEYEHVRMEHGIDGQLSTPRWEELLISILVKKGEECWDLKSAYSQALTMHTHLMYGREKS